MLGFLLPMLLIFAYAIAFRIPAILFAWPLSWMLLGIKKFATLGFVATLVLTTPLSRLPKRRDRS